MSHAIDTIKRFYDLSPRGIVHVGANKGQEVEAYKAHAARPIVLIEPLDEPFARLTKAVAGAPGFHCVQAVCAGEDGREVSFHVASNSGQSSSFKRPAAHLDLYPNISFAPEPLKLRTRTLDSLLEENAISFADIDYLTMDTQGSEMDVLQGAPKLLPHLSFIWTEVNFGGLYEGDVSLYQMTDYLRARGFQLCYLVMRKHRWGDALYVRNELIHP